MEQLHIDQERSDSDEESEQNLVLEEFGSDNETGDETGDESQGEEQTVDPVPLVVQTRYGRCAGNLALSNLQ